MLDNLVWATGAVLLVSVLAAYAKYKDVFHPLMYLAPMCAFMYVYLPVKLIGTGDVFAFVSEERLVFFQSVILAGVVCLVLGCLHGSNVRVDYGAHAKFTYERAALQKVGYTFAIVGFSAWFYTLEQAGGIMRAFGRAYGGGWSGSGYVREAVYLLIAAILFLMSREAFDPRNQRWRAAIAVSVFPWLMKGLMGARRGPMFVVAVTVAVSWYFAHRKRPSLPLLALGGMLLGGMMLFLVTNRGSLHLGSSAKVSELEFDVTSGITRASAANEYIFGAGCVVSASETGRYFWGKRILAELFIRPIPRQFWPTKYEDVGMAELEMNAGVAGVGLGAIMGWTEVPGAAAGMIADFFVEFSWLFLPVLWLIGWTYGYLWKLAVTVGTFWVSVYIVFVAASVFLVTQGLEAFLFRLVILSLPTLAVWRYARRRVPGSYVSFGAPLRTA